MEAIFDIWSDFRIDEFSTHQNKTFFFNIILHVVNNVSCIYDETLNLALLFVRKQLNIIQESFFEMDRDENWNTMWKFVRKWRGKIQMSTILTYSMLFIAIVAWSLH